MKISGKIFLCILFLLIFLSVDNTSYAQMSLDFQGTTYYSGNVPMPSAPSPPPSSSTSSASTTQSTSTKPHKKPTDYSWSDQASSDIANYIIQSYKQAELKKQQEALAAKKLAEEKAKQEAAKKKADAQKWVEDYKNDTSVFKPKGTQPKVMSLKDDNPKKPSLSSELKPVKGIYDTSAMSAANRAKCGEFLQNKANKANQMFGLAGSAEGNLYSRQKDLLMNGEAIDFDCSQAFQTSPIANIKKPAADYYFPPTMSEEHIRNVYAQTRIDLAKCTSGQNCSPEHIKNLNDIQIKAEQELIKHYGHKAD